MSQHLRLGVNIDHVATVRNARGSGYPDPVRAALLAAGLLTEGTPRFTLRTALMLLYLSGVSGALGFFLWTKSQKALTAFESSGINNLMLIEIALLDFLFFGRRFSPVQLLAIALVFGTIVWIQAGKRPHAKGAAVR